MRRRRASDDCGLWIADCGLRIADWPSCLRAFVPSCLRLVIGLLWLTAGGCEGPARVAMFRPMDEGVGIVKANRELLVGGLKAVGTARGAFVDDAGKRHRFDLRAKLQVVPPGHMRFVLQNALGRDEVEVGMNDSKWWLLVRRPEERYYEGRLRASGAPITGTIPLRAEQLMESLGFGPLDWEEDVVTTLGERSPFGSPLSGALQRVDDDYQQLLFVGPGVDGRGVIEKEYWLDRYDPWLLRRVVFRDGEGRAALYSELDEYRRVGDLGLQLPHVMRLSWPAERGEMEFRVRRWQERESLRSGHRAFVSPRDRGARLELTIDD